MAMANRRGATPTQHARMAHVRLDPELHRRLRIVVAARDTSMQDYLAHVVADAVQEAWPSVARNEMSV